MATTAELQVKDRIFIGGEWVEPRGAEAIEVVNPTTEEVMRTIPGCSPEDADRAVAAAREAFAGWLQSSIRCTRSLRLFGQVRALRMKVKSPPRFAPPLQQFPVAPVTTELKRRLWG